MAKIARVTSLQFGKDGPTADFGQFGSLAASAKVTTKNPATIQSLSAWLNGLGDAVITVGSQPQVPAMQDVNGVLLVAFYQLAYLFQAGIAEWDEDTTYFENSFVQVDGTIYRSKTDDNTGNDPTSSPSDWGTFVDSTPAGTLWGLVSSNDTVDAINGIHFTAGVAKDDTATYVMNPAAMTKKVSSTWATGDNSGGLDTGSIGASRVKVYLFALGKSTDPTAGDFLMSKSRTSPTMTLPNAQGFDVKRLIGQIVWDGAKFMLFTCTGNGPTKKFFFIDWPQVLTNGASTSFADVDISAWVDGNISRLVTLLGTSTDSGNSAQLYLRPKGSSLAKGDATYFTGGGAFTTSGFTAGVGDMIINTASIFEYTTNNPVTNNIYLRSYEGNF